MAGDLVTALADLKEQAVLCALLTVAVDSLKKTIGAIREVGLKEEIKIVIGGSQVDDQERKFAGADAFCQDAMCGVILAKEWMGAR